MKSGLDYLYARKIGQQLVGAPLSARTRFYAYMNGSD